MNVMEAAWMHEGQTTRPCASSCEASADRVACVRPCRGPPGRCSLCSNSQSALPAGKETGNTKFNGAKQKGTRLLTEQGLLKLVEASVPFAAEAAAERKDAEGAVEDDDVQMQPPMLPSEASTSRNAAVHDARKPAVGAAAGGCASAPAEVDPSAALCSVVQWGLFGASA